MASCPIHQCLFDSSDYWIGRSILKGVSIEPANENLLSVDKLTFQALTAGQVTLSNGCSMSAAVYVRFLRSLIEEIFCRPSKTRPCRYLLLEIWDHLDTNLESWYHFKKRPLFELLSFPQRCDILKAVGFILKNMPISLKEWQTPTNNELSKKRQLPAAIAEILLPDCS